MILLGANNIGKFYYDVRVLKDVTFNVQSNDKIGVVGVNGSGKTTLFNIITNHISCDEGELYQRNDIKVGYLTQHNDINSENTLYDECLTVFEDVIQMQRQMRELEQKMSQVEHLETTLEKYQRLQEMMDQTNGYAYDSQIKGTLKGLGFSSEDFDKPISNFSGGQKSRIQLAKLILQKPDLLLLDEPTNHLDLGAIEFLETFLREFSGACVIISHDRYFLNHIVNRIFHVENHTLKIYETNYEGFMKQRKKFLEIQWKAYENQQAYIKKQEKIIDRYTSTAKANLNRQGKSRQKQLDKLHRMEKPTEDSGKFSLRFLPRIQSGQDVLEIKDLKKSYDNREIFRNVNLSIYKNDKIGLIGSNGVGKTSLFQIVMGLIGYDQGEISLGSQVKIGYFDQEQKSLNPHNTVIEELWDAHPQLSYFQVRSYLARFLFFEEDLEKEIRTLSGGEKARISLLKLMLSESNFLLLDEPTNHLDIDSKEVLEDALISYEGTLFVISHDRYFLNKVCGKIVRLTSTGNTLFLGNYDYYLMKINEENAEVSTQVLTKTDLQKQKKKLRETEKKIQTQRKICDDLETDIYRLEEEVESLQKKTLDQEIYEDTDEMLTVFRHIEELTEAKEKLYNKWEDEMIRLEELKREKNE